MAKNEAQIKFTAETKGFNESIKKSNNEMAELRAEMKLNDTQMKSTGASVEALENKHKILSNQLTASQSKTEALSQKVDKAAEIFGENSTEVSRLRTQLLNAQTAEKKIRQAISACNDELADQRAAENQAETATEKLTNTIEEQQSELNKLKAEYTDAVLAYGKNSKEAKTLSKEIDSLSSDLDENKKAMENAESAADKLDNSLDNIDETAEKVSEGFTVMKGAMADLVADGIGAVVDGVKNVGTEAFTMSTEVDKASNSFIAQTGLSTDAAEEFEGIMTDIYNNNFGESFEDIGNAMSTVKNNMGDMDNGTLKRMTENAILLRDTFDFDVNESTRTASMLMKKFGIDGDTAYSLITQGAQNGLNKNGDLLDTLNEYSVHYQQLGFDVDDMLNMLTNGTESGTFSVDKLGDAVKEFGIRTKDSAASTTEGFELIGLDADKMREKFAAGGESAQQATQQTLQALFSMDDQVKQNQAGVDLFGTMWEDLGVEGVKALMDVSGEVETSKNALNKLNEVKYNDVGSAIEGIKRNLMTSVSEPLNNDVLPSLNDFIETVDWQEVGQNISDGIGAGIEAVKSFVSGVKETVTWMKEHKAVVAAVASVIGILAIAIGAYNVVQGIKNAMDAANVTTVWALVAAHWAQAAAAMAAIAPYVLVVAAIAAVIAIIVLCVKYWDEIVAAVKKCWDAVCETLSGWGEWINTNVIQPAIEFFKGLWDGIVNVFKSVVEWVKTNWKSIVTFIINPFAGVFNYLYDNFEGFRNFVDGVVSSIKEFFSDLWQNIKDAASGLWEGVKSVWTGFTTWIDTNIIQPVVGFFQGLWDGIKAVWDGICNVVQVAVMFIGSILQAAFNIITLPFRFIWENCKQYIFAAWEWIKNAISTAINNIKTVITTVFNAVKNTITTIFNAVKNFILPIWNAIKTGISIAVNAIKSAISTAFNAVKSVVMTIFNAVKSFVMTVWNGIKTAISTAANAIRTVVLTVFNAVKNTVTTIFNAVKSFVTTVWNSIKSAVSTAVNAVKTTVSNVFNAIKEKVTSIFNAVKSTVSNVWNGIKNAISNAVNAAKNTVSNVFNSIKSTISNVVNGIKSTVSNVFNKVKEAMTGPIEKARDAIKGVIDKIKGFFSGLKLKFPNIKLPHFEITGKFSLDPPSVPKLGIEWYKEGGIMTKPTLFGFNGLNAMMGGEAGPEAILPIDKLEGYIYNAIDKAQSVVGIDFTPLANAIENLANRPAVFNINDKRFATATASAGDSVNGLRSSFKNRGLAID